MQLRLEQTFSNFKCRLACLLRDGQQKQIDEEKLSNNEFNKIIKQLKEETKCLKDDKIKLGEKCNNETTEYNKIIKNLNNINDSWL